jgi:hypothetical protein
MRRKTLAVLALAASFGWSAASLAQTGQRYSVQGSLLYAGLYGDAFDDIKDGRGLEVQFRVTPSAWSWGGGLQVTRHDPDGEATEFFESVTLTGVFLEPRYVLPFGGSTYAPYLSGRFAFSQMTFKVIDGVGGPDVEIEVEEPTGPTINGGGGFLFVIGTRVNIDVGATFGYTQFKDINVTARNTNTGQEAAFLVNVGSGTNAVVRLGVAIGIGG